MKGLTIKQVREHFPNYHQECMDFFKKEMQSESRIRRELAKESYDFHKEQNKKVMKGKKGEGNE